MPITGTIEHKQQSQMVYRYTNPYQKSFLLLICPIHILIFASKLHLKSITNITRLAQVSFQDLSPMKYYQANVK